MTVPLAEIEAVKRAIWCYEDGAAKSPYTSHVPVALRAVLATLKAQPAMLAVIEAARKFLAALHECEPREITSAETVLRDALAALPSPATVVEAQQWRRPFHKAAEAYCAHIERPGADWRSSDAKHAEMRDLYRRMVAALPSPPRPIPEAPQWRLIDENTPKMRTILMFAIVDTETGNWKMATGFWHTGAECWEWEGRQVRKYDHQPTHWMPLPSPPQE